MIKRQKQCSYLYYGNCGMACNDGTAAGWDAEQLHDRSAGSGLHLFHYGSFLNLTVGILGDLSLGQAGFMCVGAFASAFFTNLVQDSITFTPLRFTLAILIGALVAGVFGLLIGIPVLRLSGDYLAIVTLAFGEIIKNFLNILYVEKDSHGLHMSLSRIRCLLAWSRMEL